MAKKMVSVFNDNEGVYIVFESALARDLFYAIERLCKPWYEGDGEFCSSYENGDYGGKRKTSKTVTYKMLAPILEILDNGVNDKDDVIIKSLMHEQWFEICSANEQEGEQDD
jgi:hypothetical protein